MKTWLIITLDTNGDVYDVAESTEYFIDTLGMKACSNMCNHDTLPQGFIQFAIISN